MLLLLPVYEVVLDIQSFKYGRTAPSGGNDLEGSKLKGPREEESKYQKKSLRLETFIGKVWTFLLLDLLKGDAFGHSAKMVKNSLKIDQFCYLLFLFLLIFSPG